MINFVDDLNYRSARPKGIFDMKVLRSDIVIEEYQEHNLVVNGAFLQIVRLIGNDVSGRSITKIGFGTNGTDPVVTDTTLTNQYVRQVSSYIFPEGDNSVQINWVLPADEGNGMAIIEFGLFTQNGMLFTRKTRVSAILKTSDISFEGKWTIIF
jgi:hypothetical protein